MTMLAKVTEPRVASRTREGNGADGAAALGAAAALFHGLADPTRLVILRHNKPADPEDYWQYVAVSE